MEAYMGTVMLWAGNFAPRGWMFCMGQVLPIAQNTALFSLLGTTYGGDGRVTFALPDLRGRVPIGAGPGPGLTPRTQGEVSGTETVTLQITEMPLHNHLLYSTNATANQAEPSNHILAAESQGATQIYSDGGANGAMSPTSISAAGGSQPHSNMQPYSCLNFIICVEGIFPSRN